VFEDDNLALAVLQALLDSELVPQSAIDSAVAANPYDHMYWDEIMEGVDEAALDIESDADREAYFQEACGYKYLNRDLYCALVRLVDAHTNHVPSLRELVWSVPKSLMHTCWHYWDGESREFEIASLAGLERCVGLESVTMREVRRSVALDWRPLLALPVLKEVNAAVDDAVAALLVQRGVVVRR